EGHRAAAELDGAPGDLRGSGRILKSVDLPGLGDVPVLAEAAAEIAARGAEGEHARAREVGVERLLLHTDDAEPRSPAVACRHHLVSHALPDEAEAALSLGEAAVAGAEIALDPSVLEAVPPPARMNGGHARTPASADLGSTTAKAP